MTGLALSVIAASSLVMLSALMIGRVPTDDIPDVADYRVIWAELHGLAPDRACTDPFSRIYTRMIHSLALAPARAGCHPDALTVTGVWAGVVVVSVAGEHRWSILAGLMVLGSLVLDGLDGAVAAMTRRTSRFGFVLDSVADRVVDGLWLWALVRAGGDARWAIGAAGATGMLEYVRARGLAASGVAGAITIGERPTRAIAAAIGLVGSAIWPDLPGATGGLVVTALAAGVGCLHLLVDLRRRLAVLDRSDGQG